MFLRVKYKLQLVGFMDVQILHPYMLIKHKKWIIAVKASTRFWILVVAVISSPFSQTSNSEILNNADSQLGF